MRNPRGVGRRGRSIRKMTPKEAFGFETRSAIFPGIISFAQNITPSLSLVPLLQNGGDFPGGTKEVTGWQGGCDMALTVSLL